MPSPIIPLVYNSSQGIIGSVQNGGNGNGAVSVFVDKTNNRVSSFVYDRAEGNVYFVVNNYTDGTQVSKTLVTGVLRASAPTAAGNPTLHFASVPAWVVAGMVVTDATQDSIQSGIGGSTTVLSTTATTVVLSRNAIGSGVATNDTIVFSNFFPVSGATSIMEGALFVGAEQCSCLGTDGHVYINSTINDPAIVNTQFQISKVDPATHVEVASIVPSLVMGGPGNGTFFFDTCAFKLGGVNYIAVSGVTGGANVAICNVDAMTNIINGFWTAPPAHNASQSCYIIAGPSSGTTQTMYLFTNDLSTSPFTNYLIEVQFNSVGPALTFTNIKSYAASDYVPGWAAQTVTFANPIYDVSTGNVLLWVYGRSIETTYIVAINPSTGSIVWRVQVPVGGAPGLSADGLDWAQSTIRKQSDLSNGTFGYVAVTSNAIQSPYGPSGTFPNYIDSPWQATYIEITTSTGAFTTKNDDHLYKRGGASNYWDSVNRKLLYFDGYADSTAAGYISGFTLFLPDNSAQTTPWTRTVIAPWSNAGLTYDQISALARDPRQSTEVFTWGYQAAIDPSTALTPHAVAVYDTTTAALKRAAVIESGQYGSQPLVSFAWSSSNNFDLDPLIIAPESRKLFYFHVGETNPPASFSTSRYMQMVDADTLAMVSASETPSAASAAAPWVSGNSDTLLSGPLTMCASQGGSYVFATWALDSGTNDIPFMLWQTSGSNTAYGTLNAGISGFNPAQYDFTQDAVTCGVFDGTGRLWLNCKRLSDGADVLIVCTISGVALTQQHVFPFDAANIPHVFGLQYDPDANQIVVSYGNNSNTVNTIRIAMDGTPGTSVSPFIPSIGLRYDTNGFFGTWLNGSNMGWPQDTLSGQNLPGNIDTEFVINLDSATLPSTGNYALWSLHGEDTNTTNAVIAIQHKVSGSFAQGPKASDFGYYLGNWPFLAPTGSAPLTDEVDETLTATDTIGDQLVGGESISSDVLTLADVIDASAVPAGRPLWMTIDADSGDSVFPN